MSEKDITRWHDTITPRDKAPQPWSMGSGGSWDMLEVQPIPDAMLAELAQRYHYAGTPWNCRSMPLSASDREYMYLLYSCMQGLVARMRQAERKAADGPQWRPIETAPRDETVILLGYLQHPRMEGSRLVYEGRWHSEQETWTSVNGFIVHPSATHWMPLPAAPHIEAPK